MGPTLSSLKKCLYIVFFFLNHLDDIVYVNYIILRKGLSQPKLF